MIFMIVVFLFPTQPNPNGQSMNYTIIVLGGTILLSLAYYLFPVYGGRNWFSGPVETFEDRDNTSEDKVEKA